MKSRTNRFHRCMALAVAAASCTWVTPSYACGASDTYMSTVCVLAWGRNDLRGYLPANGQTLSISQNSALFALLGTTYGGNGQSTFQLPDLRGRTIIGAGTGRDGISYAVGQWAGSPSMTLTTNNLPQHTHTTPAVALTGVTGAVDLSAATGTVNMTPVTYTANTAALTLKASVGAGTSASPVAGMALATSPAPAPRMYGNVSPDVELKAGSFGGSIAVTASGSPTVALTGTVPVTLNGGSVPAGATGVTGGSTAFSIMQPYLAMYYFIAVQGIFPSSN